MYFVCVCVDHRSVHTYEALFFAIVFCSSEKELFMGGHTHTLFPALFQFYVTRFLAHNGLDSEGANRAGTLFAKTLTHSQIFGLSHSHETRTFF